MFWRGTFCGTPYTHAEWFSTVYRMVTFTLTKPELIFTLFPNKYSCSAWLRLGSLFSLLFDFSFYEYDVNSKISQQKNNSFHSVTKLHFAKSTNTTIIPTSECRKVYDHFLRFWKCRNSAVISF